MMQKLVPMVVTDVDLARIRTFYADTLGWEVPIEVDGYLQVRHGAAADDPELAFATRDAAEPLGGPLPAFPGDGLVVSVPVADVDAHHVAVARTDATADTAPTNKPWGWRSYVVTDPAGVRLDFCQEVEQPAT
jgi:catechol 2,3-dioxygenase-like lactoylglutathione lyase family enzyme